MRISLTFLIQSSLLKYSEFEPSEQPPEHGKRKKDSDMSSDRTKLNSSSPSPSHKSRWFKRKGKKPCDGQQHQEVSSSMANSNAREKSHEKAIKRIPVVFFDEAHKLWVHLHESIYQALMCHRRSPALIQSSDAMKCLLDSMLVLTKQDRLCHVIHATSDPFYQAWLRQLNVMQHCKVRLDTLRGFQELIIMGVDYHHRRLLEDRYARLLYREDSASRSRELAFRLVVRLNI